MADQKLTEVLAGLVRANAQRGPLPTMPEVTGLSQKILAGVGLQNPYKSEEEIHAEDPRGPSVVNRVLDVMSRPLYGVLTPVKDMITKEDEGRNGLQSMWAGLSGKEKTTGRDVLDATGLTEDMSGPEKFLLGLGVDVIADPLSYVGGLGLIGKVGKAAKVSTEALHGVEEGAGRTAQSIADEISQRAAKHANDLDVVVPQKGMPAPKLTDPPRTFAAGPGPSTEMPRPNLGADLDEPTLLLNPKQSVPMKALEAPKLKPLEDLRTAPKDPVPPMVDIKKLNEQLSKTSSPVAQNILRTQLTKLKAGVKPADVLSEVRTAPVPFPELSINERWVNTARQAAQDFLKTNRMKNINHVGQTNLYNKILHSASKVRKDRRAFHVLQMLRIAEEEALSQGRHLVDAEGISVRLSDVANMLGGPKALNPKLVDDFRKARPSQQVEDLKAYNVPKVASEILDPVVKTGKELVPYVNSLPPSQTVMVGSDISKALRKIAEDAGASSKESKAAKNFVDDLFSVDRDKLYGKIDQEARNLIRQSSTGVVDSKALSNISEETYKSLGLNPKILGREVAQRRVTEAIMTKFATWWGAKDLKPFSREYIDTARNVASAFAETITPLVRSSTPTQRKVAFSVAQGKMSPGSEVEQNLANQFKYMVERLMGTHGITDNAEAVVLRSGTLLKELNDELPEALQLINKKGTDELGRAFDYSKNGWMHSWKEWKVDEPAEALYQLTRSLQMVTRKNAMWDDAAARWGMPIKKAEFQYPVTGINRLSGTYFPKQIADQLNNLQKQLERDVFKSPNKAVDLFDKVQRMWKTGVTIYSPAHHIRNLNGDIYLAALDGVVSPRPYAIATQVLHAFPTRFKDLESVFNIMDPKLREQALRSRPGNTVLTTRRGDKLTAEQIYQAAESQGLFARAMHAEDLVGESAFGTFGSKFKPFGGKVYDAATRASELRDHWVRLAHFTDVLSKSNQPLRVAIDQAGRRVKKFHPDGMDLTGFEQNVLRRVIPFYSWMRKATPLVIEGAIMRPHITVAFPKAMANIQYATGIESNGPGAPFPMDQMFPDWLKEKGIGPIFQPGSGLGRDANWRGEAPGYTIANPSNPFIDQLAQLGSPGKTLLSGLTPAARVPIELLMGNTTLGIPLESVEGGVPGYLAGQIPAVGVASRLTGATRDNEPWNPEQLINWSTGAGITGTGPYQSQSQMEIRELLREIAKKNRGDYR